MRALQKYEQSSAASSSAARSMLKPSILPGMPFGMCLLGALALSSTAWSSLWLCECAWYGFPVGASSCSYFTLLAGCLFRRAVVVFWRAPCDPLSTGFVVVFVLVLLWKLGGIAEAPYVFCICYWGLGEGLRRVPPGCASVAVDRRREYRACFFFAFAFESGCQSRVASISSGCSSFLRQWRELFLSDAHRCLSENAGMFLQMPRHHTQAEPGIALLEE